MSLEDRSDRVDRTLPRLLSVQVADDLRAQIMAGSLSAVRAALAIMADTRGIADTVTAVHSTADAVEDQMLTDDAAEGMKALAERRAPRWWNR